MIFSADSRAKFNRNPLSGFGHKTCRQAHFVSLMRLALEAIMMTSYEGCLHLLQAI